MNRFNCTAGGGQATAVSFLDFFCPLGTPTLLDPQVYPDAGVAAMLAYQWKDDARFRLSSLNDRKPVQP